MTPDINESSGRSQMSAFPTSTLLHQQQEFLNQALLIAALSCDGRTLTKKKPSVSQMMAHRDGLPLLSNGEVSASWFSGKMSKNLWLPGR